MRRASAEELQLAAALAGGEEAAVEQVVQRHLDGLYHYCRRFLPAPQDAEDVVQEVFLTLWNRPAAWNPRKGSLGVWLFRLAHNRCVDMQRSTARRGRIEAESPDPAPLREGEGAPAVLDDPGLNAALQRLRPDHANALLLVYGQGMAIAELAQVTGVSEQAASSLLARARRGLRKELDDAGEGEGAGQTAQAQDAGKGEGAGQAGPRQKAAAGAYRTGAEG